MLFDPENKIVRLCAEGMFLEGETEKAKAFFDQAWNEAENPLEKFIAAHYLARHQKSAEAKLKWDLVSLEMALQVEDPEIKASFPSLYLNIGKDYEDTHNYPQAKENYCLALASTVDLPDDGFSQMLKKGIQNGLKRIEVQS